MRRKFMHRAVDDISKDPMDATKRTVFFNKKKPTQTEQNLDFSTDPEIEEKVKELNKKVPKVLKEYSDPVKSEKKLNSLQKKIESEKKSHDQMKQNIVSVSKSLKDAKAVLSETQKKLDNVIDVEFERYENNRLEMIGEMSSKMAHDIRNPLAVLQSQIDLMKIKHKKQEDAILVGSISRMEDAVNHITNQINDVLGFIRKPEIELTQYDLKELFKRSIDEVHIPKGVDVEMDVKSCAIYCDVVKIRGIITNILQNGVQAVDSKGKIQIIVEEQDAHVDIKIIDSGPGIPDEHIDKIFQPMFTTKSTGTGLGLASCKQLLEMHGGTIKIENNPTTFTIILPKNIP